MSVVVAPSLGMSVEQRAELELIGRSGLLPYRVVVRAKALLPAADGMANAAIAREVGKTPNTVRARRK